MEEADRLRRRAARRFNERVKLLAGAMSNIGVATFVGVLILPSFAGRLSLPDTLPWILVAIGLHGIAQLVLSLYASED